MKVNRISALFCAASVAALAAASPLSPSAALDRVRANAPASAKALTKPSSLKLVQTKTSALNVPTVYLFAPEDNSSFLLVSADDAVTPLLGYGATLADENGKFAPEFEYWLDFMSRRTESVVAHSGDAKVIERERPYREPVAPLLKSTWSQTAPYNNLCPKEGSERTVTGCVATAMAQTMRYFQWPEIGEGSIYYDAGSNHYSTAFDKWNYDFEHMLDAYSGDEEKENWLPVARLMYLCGHSVKMNYGVDGSGALSYNVASALGSYFFYDKSVKYLERDYYILPDWEEMIYNNLVNVGPVIYNGQSYIGGHSFVCDGYDKDGYFHFNWGWGGLSDGYFVLDVLDPLEQGTGGSQSNSGFDFMQDIILGIRPDITGDSQWSATMVSQDPIDISYDEESNIIYQNNMIYSDGPGKQMSGMIALAFTPEGESLGDNTEITALSFSGLDPMYGFSEVDFDMPDLEDGRYIVQSLYAMENDDEYSLVPYAVYDASSALLEKKNGKITVSTIEANYPDFIDGRFPGEIYQGNTMNVSGKLVNNGNTHTLCFLSAIMINEEMTKVMAAGLNRTYDLAPGQEIPIDYNETFSVGRVAPSAGNYYLAMAAETSGGYKLLSEPMPVKYFTKATAVENIDAESADDADRSIFTISGVKCPDIRSLSGQVKIVKTQGKTKKIIGK